MAFDQDPYLKQADLPGLENPAIDREEWRLIQAEIIGAFPENSASIEGNTVKINTQGVLTIFTIDREDAAIICDSAVDYFAETGNAQKPTQKMETIQAERQEKLKLIVTDIIDPTLVEDDSIEIENIKRVA